jgi:hypothetical protein
MTRDRQRGQAAIELVACIPIVIAAALMGWQLAAVAWAGILAEEEIRRAGIAATGTPGSLVVVDGQVAVPGVLGRGLEIRSRGVVRAP